MTDTVEQLRRAVVGLIIINALIGIIAILGGTGDLEWEILGTTLLITAATLTAAINAAAFDRGVTRLLCVPAVIVSWFAYGSMIVWIWRDTEPGEAIQDVTFIALNLGLGATFAALLLQVRIAASFEPARIVAIATDVWMVAMAIIAILWDASSGELFGVASIVGAAASLIVIVGTRNVGASEVAQAAAFCPACGSTYGGFGPCPNCGARFSVEFKE